jgi:hypothetical protein
VGPQEAGVGGEPALRAEGGPEPADGLPHNVGVPSRGRSSHPAVQRAAYSVYLLYGL